MSCVAKKVEVFTAGCELCSYAEEIVNRVCKDCDCEIDILNVNASSENMEKANENQAATSPEAAIASASLSIYPLGRPCFAGQPRSDGPRVHEASPRVNGIS